MRDAFLVLVVVAFTLYLLFSGAISGAIEFATCKEHNTKLECISKVFRTKEHVK